MTSRYYILKGRRVIPVDIIKWATFFGNDASRIVGKDTIGGASISTVFLGIDHRWGEGEPLLFETMIFGGPHDGFQLRYSTYEQAERGHKTLVEKFKRKL